MKTRTSLWPEEVEKISNKLAEANRAFLQRYPGESHRRQAVHTVYGGAHLFQPDTAQRLGAIALRSLKEFAPDFDSFASVFGIEEDRALSAKIYDRVVEKLQREPVEDFRLDFEDGYGPRTDLEENRDASASGIAVGRGFAAKTLPPFIGVRIKPLNEESRARSVRTLDIFMTAMLVETGGRLPANFVVTLPKIQLPEQVSAAVRFLEMLEARTGLADGILKLELMIETPQAIINHRGQIALASLIEAAEGRCHSLHFGVYDYTASCGLIALDQSLRHPACDFARQMMLVAAAGTGLHLAAGATDIFPTAPHRAASDHALTAAQERQNRDAVHAAWRVAFEDNLHALRQGFYQGWDLHPAQLVTRYAAVYYFFLHGLTSAAKRWQDVSEKPAANATAGQALLDFFRRGFACGAITESEAQATGFTPDEIRTHSFAKILEARRA